ncbi:hypothetical protein MTBLM5_660005 [Magnetospirillum sp. LM-5]|nr:hypothetical protein MTBLM5_660005 [Magnetospirillum sp. LM-5]
MLRYNADGVDGLFDRPKGRRAEWLTGSEQATLAAAIFKGPKPKIDGVCTWLNASNSSSAPVGDSGT